MTTTTQVHMAKGICTRAGRGDRFNRRKTVDCCVFKRFKEILRRIGNDVKGQMMVVFPFVP